MEQVKEILQVLSENEACIGPLQEKLVPSLVSIVECFQICGFCNYTPFLISKIQVSILNLEDRLEREKKHVMQETALDILEIVVKHSPKPLSEALINTAFPATVHCILRTDDPAIMQNGGECLRSFINGRYFFYLFKFRHLIAFSVIFAFLLQLPPNKFVRTTMVRV